MSKICDECETVAHCTKYGCVPKQQALDKKAENARELGLDYDPSAGTQVSKVWWDGEKLMAKPIPLDAFYEPAQQEPVAWGNFKEDGTLVGLSQHPEDQANWTGRKPLYTSPPASKPWVGLTQQDIDIAFDDTQEGGGFNEFARAIEAKLREKNYGTR